MKINTDKISGIAATKSAKKAKNSENSQEVSFSSFLSAASSTTRNARVEDLSILPSSIDFNYEPDQENQAKADEMLSYLEKLRLDLLTGKISRENLHKLSGIINLQKMNSYDPKLQSLLQEIETRAAIELAKLEYLTSN